jgi:hypothetical protein
MDPRIGWHPSELVSNAYSTWTNIWMIAQLNSATTTTANNENNSSTSLLPNGNSTLLSNNVNSNQSTSSLNNNENTKSSITSLNSASNSSMSTTQKVRTISGCNDDSSSTNLFNYNSNSLNSVVTPQAILNGLKSRKTNKASTYGFNFPINQEILDDPMSTPWNYLKLIKLPNLITDHLISNNNNINNNTNNTNNNSLTSSIASSPSNQNDDDSNSTASSYSSTTNSTDEQDNISVNNDSNDTTSNSIKNNGYYSESLIDLHKEIMLFSEYITPTVEEIYMRNEIIWRITKIIKDQLPQAEVDVFGSYKLVFSYQQVISIW